ncbi:hypothetical protein lerEdw1_009735 [Lerista edwardsae]|nr:hypothetical protein lerEdw1_009735 [Lerista edwardsae]
MSIAKRFCARVAARSARFVRQTTCDDRERNSNGIQSAIDVNRGQAGGAALLPGTQPDSPVPGGEAGRQAGSILGGTGAWMRPDRPAKGQVHAPAASMRRRRAPSLVCALLLLLHMRPQVPEAVGTFELQIRGVRNEKGVLADGRCCRGGLDPPCPPEEQCQTFFRACLKEYQLRALPGGPCVLGAATTPVLGGNVFSASHRKVLDRANGMVVPFDFAWPRSYSLVLEAWDASNASDVTIQGGGQLMERVTRSGMLNPGEGWQDLRHHGRSASLEYRVRVRCQEHYYGPACNLLCRPRDDFFGHHGCDAAGNKVCLDGWTGDECKRAICRQGCHEAHGFCDVPGECRCHYGWTGPLCDECVLFPGCVHGSCTEPWKCDCETNWGGLLCDKDLNYCGSHQPCRNGGTCANKEPNEYECLCPKGFHGRNCEGALLRSPVAEFTCMPGLCSNGGTCLKSSSGSRCICPPGWSGDLCQNEVTDCRSEPCSHGGSCRDLPAGFKCLCPPQWTGKTCQIDVNECQKNPCRHARGCKNLIGAYFCDCLKGWTGPNCSIREDLCQGRCRNGGTCQVRGGGGHSCSCLAGYTGTECETELGACASAPCLHGGECQETESKAFQCRCPSGFRGHRCETSIRSRAWWTPACQTLVQKAPPARVERAATSAPARRVPLASHSESLARKGRAKGPSASPSFTPCCPWCCSWSWRSPSRRSWHCGSTASPGRPPPALPEPASNNSLQPDAAVLLIRNVTHSDAEPGLREEGLAAKAGLSPAVRPPCGLPKTDISNEERAKLNRLNTSPDLQRPSL